MMDNDNQNQPGTSYQPGQQTQPGYPQQQPMQPVPPTNQPPLQTNPSSPINRKLLIVAAVAMVVVAIIAVALALFLGQDLRRVESDELTFSVELPASWENTVSSSERLSIVNSSPSETAANEQTSIVVSREIAETSREEFIADGERSLEILQSQQAQEAFGTSLGEVSVEVVGTDELYGEKITYQQTDVESGIEYMVVKYRFLESDNSVVIMRFLYSDEYAEVANWIDPVRESYSPK